MRKIYIICSVRKLIEEEKVEILAYVDRLEEEGCAVRCPFRDTNQNDEIGLRIVEEHEDDIIWADEIHIVWNPGSEGSLWDVAQARMARHFMPEKKIIVVNAAKVEITTDKTYTNVVLATHFGLSTDDTLNDLNSAQKQAAAK